MIFLDDLDGFGYGFGGFSGGDGYSGNGYGDSNYGYSYCYDVLSPSSPSLTPEAL